VMTLCGIPDLTTMSLTNFRAVLPSSFLMGLASTHVGTRDLSYIEMLCVLVTLATSDTGVTSPRPEHHRQAGWN
jgi:hypothetical protein